MDKFSPLDEISGLGQNSFTLKKTRGHKCVCYHCAVISFLARIFQTHHLQRLGSQINSALARLLHTCSSRGAANPDAETTGGQETMGETALALRGQPGKGETSGSERVNEGDGLQRRLYVSYCPRSNSRLTQYPSGVRKLQQNQYEIFGLPHRFKMSLLFLIFFISSAIGAPVRETGSQPFSVEQRLSYLEAMLHNEDPSLTGMVSVAAPWHTAWMMVAALLVLFMVLPGLALFYGGLVRQKNVLSILATCLGIAGLVIILWWAFGYSLVFGHNFHSPFLGGSEYFFLQGVNSLPNTNYAYWIPQNIFCIYELAFAIITPALIFGASAERMKFSAVLFYSFLWMFCIYFPLAHMVWGSNGLLNGLLNPEAWIPALDFAGGTVVHMSSGWSALVLCIILGKRLGHGKEPMMPHSLVLTVVGTGILWIGWYGFNAGSALGVDSIAMNAFMTTTLAAGAGCLTWPTIEFLFRGKLSVLGFCSGAVAGLVAVTPACGFINSAGAIWSGFIAAIVTYFACTTFKKIFHYDDALDSFGIHGVGGTIGALLTGVFATSTVNAHLISPITINNGLEHALKNQTIWLIQAKALGMSLLYVVIVSLVIAAIVNGIIGLRASQEAEAQGLDISDHGEEGYTLNG
jgi:Amt family ammonium transporter